MKLLRQIESVLNPGRRAALRSLVRQSMKAGQANNSNEAKAILSDLISKIAKSTLEPISKFRAAIAGQKISSDDWNDMQKEMYIDMFGIYAELEKIDKIGSTSFASNLGDFNQTKAAIIKSLNEIQKYQFLKNYPSYQDIKYIDFSDARNLTNKSPNATIDANTRKLELASRRNIKIQNQIFADSSTNISIEHLGGGITNNLDQSLDTQNMLDEDPRSFWAQLVLTDERIQHTYTPSSDAGLGSNFISNGAIGEIDIQFAKTNKVNNISILPFASYPVRIIDLAYKQNPSDPTYRTIKGFKVGQPTLDWYEISFRPTAMSNLLVVLEQENFEEKTYHIPSNIFNNQMIWSQIVQEEYDQSIFDFQLDDLNYGVIKAEPEKLAFLNATYMVAEEIKTANFQNNQNSDQYKNIQHFIDAMSTILSRISLPNNKTLGSAIGSVRSSRPNTPETIEIKKLEYMYGIRSIDVSYIKYQPVSFYGSPSFNSNATITEVSIESEESHSLFNDGYFDYRRTSVEYELEFADNTRLPILPDNAKRTTSGSGTTEYQVQEEYIKIPRNDSYGITRFKPTSIACFVRKNGVKISLAEYTFEIFSNRGKLTIIKNYDANSIYTITYNVGSDTTKIDALAVFNSKEFTNGEIFTETNSNNAIKLSYYPYTEYEIVNNTSSWTKLDGESTKWIFEPTKPNYRAATVSVTNNSLNITGNTTEFIDNIDMSAGITNYFRAKGDTEVYKIESISNDTLVTLDSAYQGTSNTSAEYQISQSYYVDGQHFRFENITYEPTRIFVNDIKAFNLTNFEKLENPAFVDNNSIGLEYQYIQAGPFIYFSKPIKQSNIKVFYRWLTQYVKLNITLRCNINVATDITPKVDNVKIKIKNTKL
jgi:hypothetical protein